MKIHITIFIIFFLISHLMYADPQYEDTTITLQRSIYMNGQHMQCNLILYLRRSLDYGIRSTNDDNYNAGQITFITEPDTIKTDTSLHYSLPFSWDGSSDNHYDWGFWFMDVNDNGKAELIITIEEHWQGMGCYRLEGYSSDLSIIDLADNDKIFDENIGGGSYCAGPCCEGRDSISDPEYYSANFFYRSIVIKKGEIYIGPEKNKSGYILKYSEGSLISKDLVDYKEHVNKYGDFTERNYSWEYYYFIDDSGHFRR